MLTYHLQFFSKYLSHRLAKFEQNQVPFCPLTSEFICFSIPEVSATSGKMSFNQRDKL